MDEDDIKMHIDIANRNRKVYSSTQEQLNRNKKANLPTFESAEGNRV